MNSVDDPRWNRNQSVAIAHRGFTLIEMMIAITLGILISLGLVVLFQATAKTNRVQDAMAQLQESGRYAISRIDSDIRMASFQSLNVSGFVGSAPDATVTPNGVSNPAVSITSYVATIALPDFGPNPLGPAVGWSNPSGTASWPSATPWVVSQRYALQGYECSSGTCSPSLPTGTDALPAAGNDAGDRVGTGDVLTLRYLNSLGWSRNANELAFACTGGVGGTLDSITVTPASTSPAFSFANSGDLALLVGGSKAELFQVNAAGTVLSPTSVVGGSVPCPVDPDNVGSSDVTLYNFSLDYLTVTYYLKLTADPDNASRVVPVLIRRASNIRNKGSASNDQELVQGIEQLDFLAGVQRADGTISYLTSNLVDGQSSVTTCPAMSQQVLNNMPAGTVEPACLWRSLNSIEVHLLVDSVSDYAFTPADMAYQYTYAYDGTDAKQTPAPPGSTLSSGLSPGKMLRREFVSLVSVRNFNP